MIEKQQEFHQADLEVKCANGRQVHLRTTGAPLTDLGPAEQSSRDAYEEKRDARAAREGALAEFVAARRLHAANVRADTRAREQRKVSRRALRSAALERLRDFEEEAKLQHQTRLQELLLRVRGKWTETSPVGSSQERRQHAADLKKAGFLACHGLIVPASSQVMSGSPPCA